MKNKTMKLFSKFLILSLIFNTIMFGITIKVSAENMSYEVVLDKESGRILYAKNENICLPMASTTKVLTCITVIENYDLKKQLTIKKEWVGIEGSSMYLKEGESFTVEELLYGLMLRSGNDCAMALACGLSGSVENFAIMMNDLAVKIGAKNSSFKNPHGLNDENHFTTAYDLALITCYAMKNEVFKSIVSTKKITVGQGDSKRVLYNKNKMLFNYEFSTGVKTGYTKKAGRCLVSSAKKGGWELVCVVLNCGPMYERSEELLEKCYNEYNNVVLVDSENSITEVVAKNGKKLPAFVAQDICYPLTEDEAKMIEIEILPYESSKILPKFNQECGTIKIYLEKQLLFEEKIYTII